MDKKNESLARKEWEAKIIAHAWKDASYKKLLLSNPREALKQIGCPFYDKFKINVIEEQQNALLIVLSNAPADTKNLSEADLQSIAGGITMFTNINCCQPKYTVNIPICK